MKRPEGEYVEIIGKPKKSALVAKGNLLVHASYWMTALEKKMMWWIIWAYQEHQSQKLTLKISPFLKWASSAKNNGRGYDDAWFAARRLRGREIAIQKENEDRVGVCGFLRYAEYGEDRSGEIDVVVTDEILPYIESYIKDTRFGFTRYELQVIGSLQTFHAHRLFEVAKAMNFGSKKKQGFRLSVEELRTKFGCLTKDKKGRIIRDEYKEWKRFKSKVLDKAIKEVGECSDLKVSYVLEKSGRSVSGVRMLVSRGDSDGYDSYFEPEKQVLSAEMGRLGVSKSMQKKFLSKYTGEDLVVLELAANETNRQAKGGKIENPAGLFVELVKVDLRQQQEEKLVKWLDRAAGQADLRKRKQLSEGALNKRSGRKRSIRNLLKEKKFQVVEKVLPAVQN